MIYTRKQIEKALKAANIKGNSKRHAYDVEMQSDFFFTQLSRIKDAEWAKMEKRTRSKSEKA